MKIEIDAEHLDMYDLVDDLGSSSFTDLMEAIVDSTYWPDWMESGNYVRIDDSDEARETLDILHDNYKYELEGFMESQGWVNKVSTKVEDLHNALHESKPAEIFEFLVLKHGFWLKNKKEMGGGQEYIAKMCNLHEDKRMLSKEDCWDYLLCDHKEYLGDKIGELVMRGRPNGNT